MGALPAIAHVQAGTPAGCRLTLDIPADLPVLDGHFSAHPVVPGIAQIDWAVHFARQHLACTGQFHAMHDIKFTQVIIPPIQVELQLDWSAQTGRLAFCYASPRDRTSYSHGTLCFTA